MRHGLCKHGVRFERECPQCVAEAADRDKRLRTPHDAAKKRERAEARREECRRCLDVYASVAAAIACGCMPPTLDAIFERAREQLPELFDPVSQLWITNWHVRYAAVTGEKYVQTTVRNVASYPLLVHCAVFHALRSHPEGELFLEAVRWLYPRCGPYEVTPYAGRNLRALQQLERGAVETLRQAQLEACRTK